MHKFTIMLIWDINLVKKGKGNSPMLRGRVWPLADSSNQASRKMQNPKGKKPNLRPRITQGTLQTSVHYKPTDAHSYLDYWSSHNPNTKNSIPFSQFLRLRCLCSDDSDFVQQAEEMKIFFLTRHYPPHIINKALQRISSTQDLPLCSTPKTQATMTAPLSVSLSIPTLPPSKR